ncbi:DinB family protein [Emticicia agri]|uniref:DinB family protein n=1 Tax=Emticicia agri TaxID=2492393 RepID=A0A4Q5LZI2_9BACT|nr:DinB family protein [Emticicia agri]RYU95278.1 DinB family protein [Emticicia agri]
MNQIELLVKQTRGAYDWANKLIYTIPDEQWDIIPEVVESSITWQIGHLVISYYYHTIMVTVGHQMDILQQIPMKDYSQLFHNTSAHVSTGKTKPDDLKQHLELIAQKSVSIIQSLTPDELEKPLVPTPMPHPIARTRFEAIDWNIKHTMWHCGQLGILKRIVHERYDFGLRKA